MTYKELVDRIEDTVVRHKMLVDFGYGQLSDIKVLDNSEDGADYPYAFLLPSGIARTNQAVTYSFSLIVMEMVKEPGLTLQVQSDCIQYINDIIADLRFDTTFKGDINLSQSISVFRERFQDEVAGATLNLQVSVADQINDCDAPMERASDLYVYATHLVEQLVGQDVGENKAFSFTNEIVNTDDTWDLNRWTVIQAGSYKVQINYTFQFVKNSPTDLFPLPPRLRYFPTGGGQQYIQSDILTGWPETPQEGVTYTVYQEWSELDRLSGDFEFVYMEDQPGAEADLLVEAGKSIKIYKYQD